MAEKAKPRGTGSRWKQDKPRAPGRPQPRHSKKGSLQTPTQPAPSPEVPPREPLDVEPILDELLERVLTECALAAAVRQRVPFTVSRARDAILFVAEWRFLVRDDGDPEPEGDGVWKEDEEPPACPWDSWTPGVVTVSEISPLSEKVSSEDFSVISEFGSSPVCPDEVPGAAAAPDVPLSPSGHVPSEDLPVTAKPKRRLGKVPDAAAPLDVPLPQSPAAAASARLPGAAIVPVPPRPELPIASRFPAIGRRFSRAPGRGHRPSRPPPAPLDAAPVPLPAAPSEPPAGAAEAGEQEPPPVSSSRCSLASIQPRRPSRSAGVPRLAARRGATRWVLPEVTVVDVSVEPERARSGPSRTRLPPRGSLQVLPGTGRASKGEPQLCDPWLASARLAPGVTVRWGVTERRGPALAGHGGDEQGDEALRRAEQELKPILPYPECRISEYGELEERL